MTRLRSIIRDVPFRDLADDVLGLGFLVVLGLVLICSAGVL